MAIIFYPAGFLRKQQTKKYQYSSKYRTFWVSASLEMPTISKNAIRKLNIFDEYNNYSNKFFEMLVAFSNKILYNSGHINNIKHNFRIFFQINSQFI